MYESLSGREFKFTFHPCPILHLALFTVGLDLFMQSYSISKNVHICWQFYPQWLLLWYSFLMELLGASFSLFSILELVDKYDPYRVS